MEKRIIHVLLINNYLPELSCLTIPTIERYAEKIGAKVNLITNRKYPDWPILYEKIQIYEDGQDSDWNILLDADILVHPDTPDPFTPNDNFYIHPTQVAAKDSYHADRQLYMDDLIKELGSCEYFIGTASGLMNLAAAFDIKSVILVNVPEVELFYLPCLVTGNGIPELSWMYPQNVHLHLDGENELVKQFSYDNLENAINGKLYPYWSFDYLPIVFDYDKVVMDRLENSFMCTDVEFLPFNENSIDEIMAFDVLEHISYHKTKSVLKHWISLLKKDGVLIIQAPSLIEIVKFIMNSKSYDELETAIAAIFGGQDYDENYHKTIFEPSLFAKYLQESGISGDIQYRTVGHNLQIQAFK